MPWEPLNVIPIGESQISSRPTTTTLSPPTTTTLSPPTTTTLSPPTTTTLSPPTTTTLSPPTTTTLSPPTTTTLSPPTTTTLSPPTTTTLSPPTTTALSPPTTTTLSPPTTTTLSPPTTTTLSPPTTTALSPPTTTTLSPPTTTTLSPPTTTTLSPPTTTTLSPPTTTALSPPTTTTLSPPTTTTLSPPTTTTLSPPTTTTLSPPTTTALSPPTTTTLSPPTTTTLSPPTEEGPRGVTDSLSCDFEAWGLCGWKNDPRATGFWEKVTNLASSDPDNRFLSADRPLYTAVNPELGNRTARLISPLNSRELERNGCFYFEYIMFIIYTHDSFLGIRVYQKPEYLAVEDLIAYSDEAKKDYIIFENLRASAWSPSAINNWCVRESPLKHFNDNFQIIIEGTFTEGVTDRIIAIDDVAIRQGSQCTTTAIQNN
nr:mucin-2-like [Maniola hyperantus]